VIGTILVTRMGAGRSPLVSGTGADSLE